MCSGSSTTILNLKSDSICCAPLMTLRLFNAVFQAPQQGELTYFAVTDDLKRPMSEVAYITHGGIVTNFTSTRISSTYTCATLSGL
jgi:hypothetical protein